MALDSPNQQQDGATWRNTAIGPVRGNKAPYEWAKAEYVAAIERKAAQADRAWAELYMGNNDTAQVWMEDYLALEDKSRG